MTGLFRDRILMRRVSPVVRRYAGDPREDGPLLCRAFNHVNCPRPAKIRSAWQSWRQQETARLPSRPNSHWHRVEPELLILNIIVSCSP